MSERVERLRERLASEGGPEHLLVTNLENVRYLSGFGGSAGALLIGPEEALFFADPRYHDQARRQCPGFEVIAYPNDVDRLDAIAATVKERRVRALLFESAHTSQSDYAKMVQKLAPAALGPASDLVESLRRIKDAGEIEAIRKAAALADRTFEHILGCLKPGVTEREVALEIDFFMRRNGADKEGFDSIVASGPNSAYPHHHPTDRALQPGDLVKLDFGPYMGGYNADITRTVCLAPATDRHREIYAIVLGAQQAALDAIRPGVPGKDVHQVALDYIAERGHKEHFGHGLGHALGREVHDGQGFSQRSEITTEAGMVITVEPGIYLEGWGGIRIEDDILVTESGCELLTHARKDFLEL